jgi:hypothetical protein
LRDCCVVRLRDCCVVRLRDCCVARLRVCCVARLRSVAVSLWPCHQQGHGASIVEQRGLLKTAL